MTWKSDRERGTRQQRGYGAKWQKLREFILKRDNGICQMCIKQGKIIPAKQVDHIIPKTQGGTDDTENLQSLCVECHNRKTATEKGYKVSLGCDKEGNPVDPKHHWNKDD